MILGPKKSVSSNKSPGRTCFLIESVLDLARIYSTLKSLNPENPIFLHILTTDAGDVKVASAIFSTLKFEIAIFLFIM